MSRRITRTDLAAQIEACPCDGTGWAHGNCDDAIDAACEIPDLETMRPIPERAMDRTKSGVCFVGNCEEMP